MNHVRWTLATAAIALATGAACTPKRTPEAAPTAESPTSTPTPTPEVQQVALADVGLDASALDRNVNPCEDFYQFACGGWIETTEIPADKARWSRSFNGIDERNEQELRRILEEAQKDPGGDPALEKLGTFYGACMDEQAIEAAGLKPVDPLLKKVRSVKDRASLVDAIIELQKHRVYVLFDISAEQDFKNATQVIAFLDQNGVGLPDRDYYLKDDEKSKEIRAKYLAHVERMLVLGGAKKADAKKQAQQVMQLETELAKVAQSREERRNPEKLYNKIDRAGVEKTAPSMAWNRFFESLGRPDIQDVVVTSPTYLAGVDKLLRTTKPDVWRAYLTWHVLRSTAPALSKAFVDESFSMTQALTGQAQLEERWKRCIDATDNALGELLGQQYVKTRFAGESKSATEDMVREISRAFDRNLATLDWMDEATKEKSREKLGTFVYHIGYPSKWREYDFDVTPSFAANVLASRQFELNRDMNKLGKPVDREEWVMSPPTVNAYYNPLKNEMVFPAGILQPPFFDKDASLPVNMGGMGMVVGHELTHGFDDEGSKFAADGNLANWWTPEVRERFEQKTQCVVDQYASYEAVPGVNLNGKLTLGENIADIGGVKLAFSAYRQMRQDDPVRFEADGFSEDQQFFLAVGQAWCNKAREEVARMLAQVDPHSPPRYRVNGSLANTPEFAEAFQCAPGTPMRPHDACRVW